MKKYIRIIFVVASALSFGSVYAAEQESAGAETATEPNTEEVVLSQADNTDSEEAAASQEGDDDFVPSAQISEDLSVSFPVDI